MMSMKRGFLQTCLANYERPSKRPSPAASDSCSASWTLETPSATCPEVFSPEPRSQSALGSPFTSNTTISTDSLPKSPGPSQEVCYGMLCGVSAQFLDDPKIASVHAHAEGSSRSYYELQISKKRIYMLQAQDGSEIALINTNASKALDRLDDGDLARYTAYVSAAEWTEKMRSFRVQGKRAILEIDVYFFGNPAHGPTVGRILSNARLFLQRPDFLDSSVQYENPHEIRFTSLPECSPDTGVPALAPGSVNTLSMDMVEKVLGDLDHSGQLTAADVDPDMIVTKLKPHQKEAVDFFSRRESHNVPEGLSLFKHCVDPRNRKYWEHTVAGCRKMQRPDEGFGGIIADEMGLGKTLTMIAAISMTLKQAWEYVNHSNSGGDPGRRTAKASATLVVCPSVLLIDEWSAEISKHTAPGRLKCMKYHGTAKVDAAELINYDVVLTTYATLTADSSQRGVLHSIQWFRVTLDEAHSIRHQSTKQFRAVVSLSARHRWCLTGTPIQNTLDDLGALVRFLRVLDMEQASNFRTLISGPIDNGDAAGLLRLQNLMRCICLRRTRELLSLPDPDEQIKLVRLTDAERAEYCRIGDEHRQAIDEALCGRNPADAYRGLFSAILRLRIFCNSGSLGSNTCGAPGQRAYTGDEKLSLLEQGDEAICASCSCDVSSIEEASMNSGTSLDCLHVLCQDCVRRSQQHVANGVVLNCPVCRARHWPQPQDVLASDTMVEVPSAEGLQSSKLDALVQDISMHGTEKCIVFSSWKKSIHLVASYLTARGIPNCVVDGSMTLPERHHQLLLFQREAGIPALLMTLGTGAVGLNLTVASRIHILEPQWNPSIERQAIGRAVRLGQQKKVTVVRYVVQETVEQYIQTRQKKKLYLAQLGWGANKDSSDDEKLKNVMTLKSLLSTS